MITPDQPAAAADDQGKDNDTEQCVPVAALAVEGTAPAVGDAVEYNVKGKISRVEGEHAYVTPESVNDQPVTAPTEPAPEPTGDDMLALAGKEDAAAGVSEG